VEWGFTILSGDQIAAALAVKLNAERIIMGIDVDGLYDSDPKRNFSARLITEVSLKDFAKLIRHIGGSQVPDVTGGMLGVNALSPNNIYKALKGEEVVGTRIKR